MDVLLILVFILVCLLVPVVALALLLYAIPVRASVRLIRDEASTARTLEVSWAGFGVRSPGTGVKSSIGILLGAHQVLTVPVPKESPPVGDSSPESAKNRVHQETPGTVVQSDAAKPAGNVGLNAGGVITVVLNIVRPLISFGSVAGNAFRFVDARGTMKLGLGDPVSTGEICGIYWASKFVMMASRVYVDLEPVFDREVLNLDITLRFTIRHPLLVLIAAARLSMDPGVRGAGDTLLRRKAGAVPT